MAIYKIFPVKDASIYSLYPNMNTGIDEIIECSTDVDTTYDVNSQSSRFLIQFSQDEINNVLQTKVGVLPWSSSLKIFLADGEGFSDNVVLEFYPISSSWAMGTGKFLDNPQQINGVSWNYRDYYGSKNWRLSNFGAFVTASYPSSYPGGATWYTASSNPLLDVTQTQSLGFYSTGDISVNVTDTIKAWVSGTIVNNGFIVKQQTEFPTSSAYSNIIQYFSMDTNTIYPPQLEIKWRDYSYNSGVLPLISSSQIVATLPNNSGVFYSESIQRFRVNVRPQYPPRVFTTSSLYSQNYVLPSSSYYAIKDLDTNEFVVDFDTNFTQISADPSGSYFDIYMNGLQPERYYKLLIQTTTNGSTLVLDNNYIFKVVNG